MFSVPIICIPSDSGSSNGVPFLRRFLYDLIPLCRYNALKSTIPIPVATFEATEAAASVLFTTLASVKNNYFYQFNYGRPME